MDRIYTKSELLELVERLFVHEFFIEDDKKILVFYSEEFYFKCLDISTADTIAVISLKNIYDSCNSINSNDEPFYSEEDLLMELNELVDSGSIVEYISKLLNDKYQITMIKE